MQTKIKGKQTSWIGRYTDGLIRWRWLVAIGMIVLALLAASGGRFLGFNNEYRVFFSDDNPQLQAFDQLQRTYTKVDNIIFAIAPVNGDASSPQMLALIEELTEQAWQLPFSLRVDSLSNFQYTWSQEDDLIVQDLYENGASLDADARREVMTRAQAEPFLAGKLLNTLGTVTGVNVTFQMPQKSQDEPVQAVAAARILVDTLTAKYNVKIHLGGMVMLSNSFYESAMQDMGTLVPAMYAMIILVTFLLVRSKSATFATTFVIILSVISSMGLAGYAGILLTPPSSSAMTIIMTLAVADSIHLLVSMFSGMRHGMTRHTAIKESLRLNFGPVALTSLTTAVGFLSMNFSDSPPFHDLGNIAALGVGAAWLFSVTLLPALMAIFPAKSRKETGNFDHHMVRLGEFVIARRRSLLWGSILVSVLLLSFIPRNELNDNFIKYFDKSIAFRGDSDFINTNLTGLYQIQYSLDSGESNGIATPEFLGKADSFVQWLRAQPEVRHVNSITDTFKRLNKNMHSDDASFYKLPENRELAAQYLLLYELSLPYGLDLNNQINIDKSSTQVIATVEDMSTNKLCEVAERGSQWLKNNTGLTSIGVGPTVMFAHITERNIHSMLLGTLVALVLISGLIMVALRSLSIGALSLIPNLLPAGLAFGLWGITVGEVNMGISMVTGMTLGIVVDDTIHFLSKYLRARREQDMNAEQAVRYAFSTVGVAIVTTSIILFAGFMVLAQSSFGMNSGMAMLTAIAIVVALVADLLLLPALLLRLDRKVRSIPPQQQLSKEKIYA